MEFLYAKITNSRLMGSMGLRMSWKNENRKLDQYFLLDCEGLGLADYMGICDGDDKRLFNEEERLMGGLGSDRMYISKEESVFLVKEYAGKNIRYGKPLPENKDEYGFILEMEIDPVDRKSLFFKLCKKIESDSEFINYMAMRFIARDREALGQYSLNPELKDMKITYANGTLLKNSVRKLKMGNYICSCIYEDKDAYFTANIGFSTGTSKEGYCLRSIKIGKVSQVDCLDVLDEIKRDEYIGVYIIDDIENFKKKFIEDMSHCLKSPFEKGLMLTQFKPDNSHVAAGEYLISNDLDSIFFVSDSGQLVVSNYDMAVRVDVDSKLLSKYGEYLSLNDEFIFSGSLIYDFAQDMAESFYEFLSKR